MALSVTPPVDCGRQDEKPRSSGGPLDAGFGGASEPEQSVNFVTCHDDFTLNDLVSYQRKHNEENAEANRDGNDDNRSWNSGVEGPTDDFAIEQLRNRQVKNFLAITLLWVGMPMIVMGDEVRRTQRGNNNAYCHDDEWTWLDWTLLDKHPDVHRFVTKMNQRSVIGAPRPATLTRLLREANRTWHGVKLHQPDRDHGSHSLAVTATIPHARVRFHIILNAYWEALEFELPPPEGDAGPWRRRIDTFLDAPEDVVDWGAAPVVSAATYRAEARSVVALFSSLREPDTAPSREVSRAGP